MVHLQQGQSPSSQMKFMLDFGFSRVIQTDGARVFTEGRTTEADARSTWELLNQMPSKPAEGGEIEQGRKQQEDKEREQGAKDDDQQALDVMLQKYKARGDEECDDE